MNHSPFGLHVYIFAAAGGTVPKTKLLSPISQDDGAACYFPALPVRNKNAIIGAPKRENSMKVC